MTVTYLPQTSQLHDDATRQNFEYIESWGVFIQNPPPVLTGSRSGAPATVLGEITAALAACGLVVDNTTP